MPNEFYSDIPGFKPYMASSAKRLRALMVKSGVAFQCENCGLTEWLGAPAPLQIDHISGDRRDNTLRNLRFLCPNCHAMTPTFAGRNVKSRNPLSDTDIEEAYRIATGKAGRAPLLIEVVRECGRPSVTTTMIRAREGCVRLGLTLIKREDVIFRDRKPSSDLWPSDDFLKRMYAEDGADQIASRLRVSVSAVRSRLVRIGVSADSVRAAHEGKREGGDSVAYKVEWPPDELLVKMLEREHRTVVARKLGVTDNAVKKRCRSRGLFDGSTRTYTSSSAADRAHAVLVKRMRWEAELAEKHGTRRGYALELKLGIPTCDVCRKAYRVRE